MTFKKIKKNKKKQPHIQGVLALCFICRSCYFSCYRLYFLMTNTEFSDKGKQLSPYKVFLDPEFQSTS